MNFPPDKIMMNIVVWVWVYFHPNNAKWRLLRDPPTTKKGSKKDHPRIRNGGSLFNCYNDLYTALSTFSFILRGFLPVKITICGIKSCKVIFHAILDNNEKPHPLLNHVSIIKPRRTDFQNLHNNNPCTIFYQAHFSRLFSSILQ